MPIRLERQKVFSKVFQSLDTRPQIHNSSLHKKKTARNPSEEVHAVLISFLFT